MFNLRNITTALALGLALAAATPSLAAERSHRPGHAARAQAVSTEQAIPGGLEVSRARDRAALVLGQRHRICRSNRQSLYSATGKRRSPLPAISVGSRVQPSLHARWGARMAALRLGQAGHERSAISATLCSSFRVAPAAARIDIPSNSVMM